MSTITIRVTIATADKWEGNSKFSLNLPEKHFKYIDRNKLASELNTLIDKALVDYGKSNSEYIDFK
jgi:hypothetical protein